MLYIHLYLRIYIIHYHQLILQFFSLLYISKIIIILL